MSPEFEPTQEPGSVLLAAIDRAVLEERRNAEKRLIMALATEREEIARLVEAMATEWRPTPGGGEKPVTVSSPTRAVGPSHGRVTYPTSMPTDIEVRVLTDVARRVRSRK